MKKFPRSSFLPAALRWFPFLLFTSGLQNADAQNAIVGPGQDVGANFSTPASYQFPNTSTSIPTTKTFRIRNYSNEFTRITWQIRSPDDQLTSAPFAIVIDSNNSLSSASTTGIFGATNTSQGLSGTDQAGRNFNYTNVQVRFTPSNETNHDGYYLIIPSTGERFNLSGRGDNSAKISVEDPTGSTLDYGADAASFPLSQLPASGISNSTSQQVFTIRNSSTEAFSVASITTTGGNSAEFAVTDIPTSVPALGSATFSITFTPVLGGNRSTKLVITHGDSPRSPFSINLQATGLAGEIGVKDPDGATMTHSATAASFPSHSFPQTPANATSSRQFTIENSGNNPLNITSITSSSGDFIVSAVPQTVAPPEGGRNGSETFLVTFSPSSGGTKSGIITINSSDPEEGTFRISVTGTAVVPDIVVKNPAGTTLGADGSPTVTLPSTSVNTAGSPQTFRIENSSSGAPLSITGITSSSTEFEVANIPGSVNPSAFQEFSVTFRPSGGGPRTGTLTITSNDPDEGTFAVNLSATGLQPDFALKGPSGAALPAGATVSLPATAVNGTTTRTFTIANSGGTPLTISNIQSSNTAEFTVGGTALPVTIGTGNEQTFTVAFEPDSQGTRQADLLVTHDDPSKPSPFQISLTGLGTSSSIAVKDPDGQYIPYRPADAPNIDLPATSVGTPSTSTFTIENGGNTALTIQSITSSNNTEFSIQNAPSSIPAASGGSPGSATFDVVFTPAGSGSANSLLQIRSNDGSKSPFPVQLRSAAQEPQVQVEVDTILQDGVGTVDFTPGGTTVFVGTASTKTLTVTNTGLADLTVNDWNITGQFKDVFSISPEPGSFALSPGASREFTIRFSPNSDDTASALLQFTANDPDITGPFDINLAGKGTTVPPDADAFGYQLFKGTSQGFQDIRNTGQRASGLSGDDVATELPLGFNFQFYDQTYSTIFANSNGLLRFGGSSTSYIPHDIGSGSPPRNIIAPFWTDLRADYGGNVYYQTEGEPGNRVFLIQYQNMPLYQNRSRAYTFQVKLTEGSNTIEFIYNSIPHPENRVSSRLLIGIENADGTGIRERFGLLREAVPINTPYSVKFTRPALIDITSTYEQPAVAIQSLAWDANTLTVETSTPNGAKAGDQIVIAEAGSPAYNGSYTVANRVNSRRFTISASRQAGVPATASGGTLRNPEVRIGSAELGFLPDPSVPQAQRTVEVGSLQNFEAPEYIYLNKDFSPLKVMGDSGVGYDDPSLAVYRLKNEGYAIDTVVTQGTNTFFQHTVNRDISIVWKWKLEYAVFIDARASTGENLNGGTGNPDPAIGRTWWDADEPVSPSIDRVIGTDFLSSDIEGVRFQTKSYQLATAPSSESQIRLIPATYLQARQGTRMQTRQLTINNWTVIRWNLQMQVRYSFSALAKDGNDASNLLQQSFVKVLGQDQNGQEIEPIWSTNKTANLAWVDVGRRVKVGSFHRTADRCLTLEDFINAPSGDLQELGTDISIFEDESFDDTASPSRSRIARVREVTATQPTTINFIYGPTVFRAEIPIGQGFDALNPDGQLVPDLCAGARLRAGALGPGDTGAAIPKGQRPDGSPTGSPLRWDQLAKRLYPVRPGTYQLDWPDESDPGTTYRIEFVTGYPSDTVSLISEREEEIGDPLKQTRRETNGSAYVLSTALASVSDDFPGSSTTAGEDAHYRYLHDPNPARQAPAKLDLFTSDQWHFREMPFYDRSSRAQADSNSSGAPFVARGEGRCVLLYSRRANSDEIATGDDTRENLVVRVVRSEIKPSIPVTDPALVLGSRGLLLDDSKSMGLVQSGTPPTNLNPGSGSFSVDFWLNASDLRAEDGETDIFRTAGGALKVTLSNNIGSVTAAVSSGSATISTPFGFSSTGDIEVTNLTTGQALLAGTDYSATPGSPSGSVTILQPGDGDSISVTLTDRPDPQPRITATFRGVEVSHDFSTSGSDWRHYIIHVFSKTIFGTDFTVVNFYADGIKAEKAIRKATVAGGTPVTISQTVDPSSSLRLGIGAAPESHLQLDNFRLFNIPSGAWLTSGEIRDLRSTSAASQTLRAQTPDFLFDFEHSGTPALTQFANKAAASSWGIGPLTGAPDSNSYNGAWARVGLQEVATRITSTLDNAGFYGNGYILNRVSNYNATLYDRTAEIGGWGPLYPVNDGSLYTSATRLLESAYYENPFRQSEILHPNVAWPYIAVKYEGVTYPTHGPHQDKRIYIASRIGSEGVDSQGKLQQVYRLEDYEGLTVYNQPRKTDPGYNPNEEHAFTAASNRAALKIKELDESIPNNPPLAAFALQKDINQSTKGATYTSDPWVLVQFKDLVTGAFEMSAYRVEGTRSGNIPFPRPTDGKANQTPGLAYESAANPEDRFLTMDPEKTFNFSYQFLYPAAAGDLLIPPYPLNLVIGNASMPDSRGGNIQIAKADSTPLSQRTLWRDVNRNAWVVSGNGKFFYQYFYPFRQDFYLPGVTPGSPVAFLPPGASSSSTAANFRGDNKTATSDDDLPVKITYETYWRSDYPKLKRGETLTYQGGEYFNENPGSQGLPALVAMAASEIVYDSATPSMVLKKTGVSPDSHGFEDYSARIIRPLDRREKPFRVSQMDAAGFTPASPKILIIAERWYFKDLPGSLQKRFYFNSLSERLVLRGYLNDKDSGDPDLTAGPDPLNILEPNILTADEYSKLYTLSNDSTWRSTVEAILQASRAPDPVRDANLATLNTDGKYYAGVQEPASVTKDDTSLSPDDRSRFKRLSNIQEEIDTHWTGTSGSYTSPGSSAPAGQFAHLNSFGTGAALVGGPGSLLKTTSEPTYITIAENNREELDGAPISLHIIELIPDRYRGALKVLEGADAFSEKVTIQHNGEFGANTDDLYYEWWIRDAAPLDVVANEVKADGTLLESDPATGQSLWQQYIPKNRASLTGSQKHLGLHSIVFEGRPDITLADKMVLMRYRHKLESDWTLVPFEITNPPAEWSPGVSIEAGTPRAVTYQRPAPFQWAGAANSPQLQADGSKRYIPQLVMGWVKRVLDRINPYEARYTDFFSNETPATYTSQIQIAGGPFAGKVALNPDKNVIENTGLIELYETVLARARELSIDNSSNPVSTDGINQALLLAATRLAVLYELLAREAYSDAQDSTITVTDDGGLTNVASFTHAFQNSEASLLHEELSLLRGTDFRKSYPVYNRMFWNFAKGLGEAAYAVNYNVYDENTDGFINEDDARALYPQGHGDAWGHFLSALGMHYELLQQPVFRWNSRPELYSLMENVLEVDYLDEKTFAKLAAGKARTGRDIVRNTYRLHYTQDPDGQWQGYTDGADSARAWGVSEWAHRTGQAAYFDWAVANALLPGEAANATPVENPEGLDRIQRSTNAAEIGEIATGLLEIQTAMDEANNGINPLGFDSNAMSFAMNVEIALGLEASHFEQIYDRAVAASTNALATLNFAAMAENKLRRIADDTEGIIVEALSQDIDYRNRLIEIFGRPYDGTIGTGKIYPEGYLGPDTLLYAYLDKTEISQIVPQLRGAQDDRTANFNNIYAQDTLGIMDNARVVRLYNTTGGYWGGLSSNGSGTRTQRLKDFETLIGDNDYDLETQVGDLSVPYDTASEYGFTAPANWGGRTSHGRLQSILEEWLLAEIAVDEAIITYIGFLQDWEVKTARVQRELEIFEDIEQVRDEIDRIRRGINGTILAAETIIGIIEIISNVTGSVAEGVKEALPTSIGFSNDVLAPARGAALLAATAAREPLQVVKDIKDLAKAVLEMTRDETIINNERNIARLEQLSAFQGMVEELVNLSGSDQPMRDAIGTALHEMELKKHEYKTTLAEGFRLMREREAFNKVLAASVQKDRYEDMLFRLSRNEVTSKYQTAFNHASRYTWMAARAYDYETSFDPGHPASPKTLLDATVKERNLGLWVDGKPAVGQGGLAEILAQLKSNFDVLKGQIGIMTPQIENGEMSLRRELFRIQPTADGTAASDDLWKDALRARVIPDVTDMPEFVRNCRSFAPASAGPQPALVIPFSSHIENGRNFFGRPLAAGDHTYSTANFATKIRGVGIWLVDYTGAELAAAPRAYLFPVGNDYLRTSSAPEPITRTFTIHEQRVPTPFVINQSNLRDPGFIPSLNGIDGEFGNLRRHGDFRMYGYDSEMDGFLGQFDAGMDAISFDTRLMGRSAWNSQWYLIIPGTNLHPDGQYGLSRLIETISDIKLHFVTYSHQGQ